MRDRIGWHGRGNSGADQFNGAGSGMKRIGIAIAAIVFVFASAASAQIVSGRVTGAVGEVGSVAGQTGVGAALSGSQAPGSSNLPNSSLLGGELPGGVNETRRQGNRPSRQCRSGRHRRQLQSRRWLAVLKAAHFRALQHKVCQAAKIDANLNETAQSSA